MVLDLALRFRVHALMEWFVENKSGDSRSDAWHPVLQVHYDDAVLPRDELLDAMPEPRRSYRHRTPSRCLSHRAPALSVEDPATLLAIRKYMQSVRPMPFGARATSNSFAASTVSARRRGQEIVFSASYLVLGLGDVYLGAPVATPVDPRHRLVHRTSTTPPALDTGERGSVSGGAYLCVYGMEGPGGYQFVGRTCQMLQPLSHVRGR